MDIANLNFGVIMGAAGSGKTYFVRQQIAEDPSFGLLTATTGPAARVLGPEVPTVHSALGFFDLESLCRASNDGSLVHNMMEVRREGYERLIIDEASMLPGQALTLLTDAAVQAGLGIILVGDWCQLPPVTEGNKRPDWAFDSPWWRKLYAPNTVRLVTQFRQKSKTFLRALGALRQGDGKAALPLLRKAGVSMSPIPSGEVPPFEGMTLTATKGSRDAINLAHYEALNAKEKIYRTVRWGHQQSDWKEIPDTVSVKVGMRCMVLRNKYDDNHRLVYANGECGVVTELTGSGVFVKRDDGDIIFVEVTHQDNAHRRGIRSDGKVHSEVTRRATAGVTYLPLAMAWAMNVHKTQGLTIESPVRIKLWADHFFKAAAMMYVAASRVTKPSLLDIQGGDFCMNGIQPVLEERTSASSEALRLEAR
jgi:ATP-dependent DNA helicase PIF1